MVTERRHPLAERREAVAVRPPLLFLPAGADPELEATAADDVDGRGHLGRQRRVAEPGAHDHVAEADPVGGHRQRGQHRERLEGDLVGSAAGRCGSGRTPRATRSRALRPASRARSSAPRPRPAASRRTRPSSPAPPSIRPASMPSTLCRASSGREDASNGEASRGSGVGAALSRRAGRAPGGRPAGYPRRLPLEPPQCPPRPPSPLSLPSTLPRHSPARPIRGPRPGRRAPARGRRIT